MLRSWTLRRPSLYEPLWYRGACIAVIMKLFEVHRPGEGSAILGNGSEAFNFLAAEDCAGNNLYVMRAHIRNV